MRRSSARDETLPQSPGALRARSVSIASVKVPSDAATATPRGAAKGAPPQAIYPLSAIRRFTGRSPEAVAEAMGEPDGTLVEHMESGADCLLSELEAYVEALGGQVEIRVSLPGWTYRLR